MDTPIKIDDEIILYIYMYIYMYIYIYICILAYNGISWDIWEYFGQRTGAILGYFNMLLSMLKCI